MPQSFTVLSPLAVASTLSRFENLTLQTPLLCPFKTTMSVKDAVASLPLVPAWTSREKILAVLSCDPEATIRSSGETSSALMSLSWIFCVNKLRSLISPPSGDAEASGVRSQSLMVRS
jgi:hypothetical protein